MRSPYPSQQPYQGSPSTLKKYMRKVDQDALGVRPTTHQNCIAQTGVARPGKTARDRNK